MAYQSKFFREKYGDGKAPAAGPTADKSAGQYQSKFFRSGGRPSGEAADPARRPTTNAVKPGASEAWQRATPAQTRTNAPTPSTTYQEPVPAPTPSMAERVQGGLIQGKLTLPTSSPLASSPMARGNEERGREADIRKLTDTLGTQKTSSRQAEEKYTAFLKRFGGIVPQPYMAEAERLRKLAYTAQREATGTERALTARQREADKQRYTGLNRNPDFRQFADRGASMPIPTAKEAEGGVSVLGWRPFGKEPENIVAYTRANAERFLTSDSEDRPTVGNPLYLWMTDDEVDTYNYLLSKDGQAVAGEYLDWMEETLNARMGREQGAQINKIENPVGRFVGTVGTGTSAGVDQWASNVRQLFSEERVPASAAQFAAAEIDEGLSDVGPKILGNSLGQVGFGAVRTVSNMAPSILLSTLTAGAGAPAAVTSGVSLGSMGAGAVGNAYNQALGEGYGKEEAMNYAMLVGASEVGLQYLLGGIGALGGKATGKVVETTVRNIDNALLRIAGTMGVKMFGEGTEEYLQEILEPAFRNLAFDENNEIKLVTEEAAYSFLMGALTAGLLEGGGVVRADMANTRTGTELRGMGQDVTQTVISEGLLSDPSTESYQQAESMKRRQEAGKPVSDAALGELYQANIEAVSSGGGDTLASRTVGTAETVRPRGTSTPSLGAVGAEGAARAAMFTSMVREGKAVGARGKAAFSATYDGAVDIAPFYGEFMQYYNAGVSGQKMDKVSSRYGDTLSQEQRFVAWKAGGDDATASLSEEQRNAKLVTVYSEGGGLVRNEAAGAMDTNTADLVDRMGKALGVKVMMDATIASPDGRASGANGYYHDGVIHIAADADNPAIVVMKHEVTHRMQELSPESYRRFRDYAVRLAGTDTVQQMQESRLRAGENLSNEAAMDEIAANLTEKLMTDRESIDRFIRDDRSAAQKFFDTLKKIIQTVKEKLGRADPTLERAAQLWNDAYRAAAREAGKGQKNTAQEGGEARLSIKYDQDNNPYVIIEGDILNGVPKKDWVKAVKENLRQKFPDGVTVGNNVVSVNKQSRREMTFSKYMQRLFNTEPGLYADKLRATDNADEILKAAQNWVNEALLHPRKDDIIDFARGEVLLRIGTSDYSAQVIVGNRGENGLLLYDIINLFPATIQERKKTSDAVYTANATNGPRSRGPASDKDSISGSGEKSNTKFSLKEHSEQERTEFSDRNTRYSIRESEPPKKTGIAYKVFLAKDGQLYPPMVANPGGAGTPIGVWLDADVGQSAPPSKTGRAQVQGGGKGTNSGKISLAFRPGWHLGDIPLAKQFGRMNPETGVKDLFPPDFVWAECEYAMDVDYQEEAMSYGYTENGQFRHSYAGLPKLPTDGYYRYRTNPNPDTVPWVITGAMKVTRILTDNETDAICIEHGIEPMKRQGGILDLSKYGLEAGSTDDKARFSLKDQSPEARAARLEELNEYLRAQLKVTKGAVTDKKAVAGLARSLLGEYSSDYDPGVLSQKLQGMYDRIANGRDLTWEGVRSEAQVIAEEILGGSLVRNDDSYQSYEALRKYVRGTQINVPRSLWSELENVGGYNEFRRANMGRLDLSSKSGMPIDTMYKELSAQYPEFFNENEQVHPADQLMRLADVLDGLQPVTENPYSGNMKEASAYLAADIIERFYETPQQKPTAMDRQARKMTQQKIHADKKLDRLRQQKNERIEAIRQQGKETVKEAVTRERARRAEQVQKVTERYKGREATGRERRSASELRRKITRHVSDLSQKLLRPSDKKHIPEALRKPVAALLEAINLESAYTVDAETGKRTKNGEGLPTRRTEAFQALRDAYRKALQSGEGLVLDPDLLGDDTTLGNLDAVIEMKDTRIADMSKGQLETVWNTVRAIEASISSANKTLAKSRYDTISAMAEEMKSDFIMTKPFQERYGARGMLHKLVNVDMLSPVDYFKELGRAGEAMWEELRHGLDQKVRDTKAVSDYATDLIGETDVRKWSGSKAQMQTFQTSGGDIQLTPAQVMSLYLLMQRKQAHEHILLGGIRQAPVQTGGKIVKSYEPVHVTLGDVAHIIGSLTDEQQRIADGLGKFMNTTLSDWGNEVSMGMYGYKKFVEENYFPIRSDANYTKTEFAAGQDQRVKNMGFTKATAPHANNAIMVEDVFDVFTSHADDMSTYHAFAAVLEDVERVYNFRYRTEEGAVTGSVSQTIERVLGRDKKGYFRQLMKNINEGIRTDVGAEIPRALLSSYKAAAVGANLRVIVQQPTAIFRAGAIIDPKYLMAGMAKKGNFDLVKEWAPIAQWKDWGYFQLDTGRQMKDILLGTDSTLDKVRELAMKPAGWADNITWSRLWNAVELEVADKRPGLERGSDAFYRAVAERFGEVVDRTQVVDSVLHRSQTMRSGNTLVQMAASFMAEPTKTYNLFRTAAREALTTGTKESRARLARVTVTLLVSGAATAAAAALVDALRDDDDDEAYREKFLQAFTGLEGDEETLGDYIGGILGGNLGDNLNPLGMVPYAKDALSIWQGYDVDRMDMTAIADLKDAADRWLRAVSGDGTLTVSYATIDLMGRAAKLLGLPLANVKRDLEGLVNGGFMALEAAGADINGARFTWSKFKTPLNDKNKNHWIDMGYRFERDGDSETAGRIYDALTGAGIPAEKIEERKRNVLKKSEGFADQKEAVRGDIASDLERSRGYARLSNEQKEKALGQAKTYAYVTAMLAQDPTYVVPANYGWVLKANGGASVGIEPWEYILFDLAYDMAESDKDADGKTVAGSKQEKVVDALDDMGWLTARERDYLYGTRYSSDKNNPYK